LLLAIDRERGALDAFLATLTPEQMVAGGVVSEWSVKDVLAHLIEWEQMVLAWYAAGLRGETPQLPAPGYKWSELPQLNQAIYEKHRDRPLEAILAQYAASHAEIVALIQQLSDDELFEARRYSWTRSNTLGAYFVSATSSHYLWARNELRKGVKRKLNPG
jgi:uncharacterized protein (TIGR03083 family)